MIALLKRIVLYLEAKYPAEVVVLTADYEKLVKDVAEAKTFAQGRESKVLTECSALKQELALVKAQVAGIIKSVDEAKGKADSVAMALGLGQKTKLPDAYNGAQ